LFLFNEVQSTKPRGRVAYLTVEDPVAEIVNSGNGVYCKGTTKFLEPVFVGMPIMRKRMAFNKIFSTAPTTAGQSSPERERRDADMAFRQEEVVHRHLSIGTSLLKEEDLIHLPTPTKREGAVLSGMDRDFLEEFVKRVAILLSTGTRLMRI